MVIVIVAITACSEACKNECESAYDAYTTITIADTPAYVTPIVFEETDRIVRSLRGFASTAQVDGRQYFFEDDNDYNNTLLVHKTESLIQELLMIEPFRHSGLRINFASDIERYRLAGAEVTTSFDNSNVDTIGWIAHAMSLYRIPLWLSVGVEAVVRGDLGFFEPYGDVLDSFGDLYFAPAVWGSTENRQAVTTAYYFVRFLQENDDLDTLLELYNDNENITANRLAAGWFYDFNGGVMDTIFEVRLTGGHSPGSYLISVSPEKISPDIGHIHFIFYEFSEVMTREDMEEYLDFVEDAFRFNESFYAGFGIATYDMDLRINLHYTDSLVGGMVGGGRDLLELFNFGVRPISIVAAHEFSHVFTHVFRLPTHPILDEGLATWLGFFHYASYHQQNGLSLSMSEGSDLMIAYEVFAMFPYENISAAVLNRILEDYDMGLYLDFTTYWHLNFGDEQIVAWIESGMFQSTSAWNWPRPAWVTYFAAGSFMGYLINNYGKEQYAMLEGFDNFEYVYSMSVDDMVAEWKVHLSDTMAAFR